MDARRRTLRFGPLHIGLVLPADAKGLERAWCVAEPDAKADLVITVSQAPQIGPAHLEFDTLDRSGCRWQCAGASGAWDARSASGELVVAGEIDLVANLRELGQSLLWALAGIALQRGGVLLHAASFALPCGAVAVCGPSGAGKSTLANRVAEFALHDDLTFVVPSVASQSGWQVWRQDAFRVRGSHLPWCVDLVGMVRLGDDRSVTQLVAVDWPAAIAEIGPHCWYFGGVAAPHLANAIANVAEAVPVGVFAHSLADTPVRVQGVLASISSHRAAQEKRQVNPIQDLRVSA